MNDAIEHRVVVARAKRKSACAAGFHDAPPSVATTCKFRGRNPQHFPDGVWIFECSNSIDGVERISASGRAVKSENSVPTFLRIGQAAKRTLRDWPDTVWLFPQRGRLVAAGRSRNFRDSVA